MNLIVFEHFKIINHLLYILWPVVIKCNNYFYVSYFISELIKSYYNDTEVV